MRRVAADLVEGDQPAVAVEQGVLQALGHDGAGELLKAAAEAADVSGFGGLDLAQERCRHEIVHRVVGQGA